MERELLLLGLLRRSDTHGYQLHEFIHRYMTSCTDLKKPTAYFLLRKMEAQGWIRMTEIQEGGRPPRRVYQLTPAGDVTFQRLLRDCLSTYAPAVFATDVGLAFLDNLAPAEAHALLSERRAMIEAQLAEAERAPLHAGSMQLLVEHRQHHLKSELEWLDRVLSGISTTQGKND